MEKIKMLRIVFLLALWDILGLNSALAQSCPDGGQLVEVPLPDQGKTIKFCQINNNGQLLKHGPEEIFSTSGVLQQKKIYFHGEIRDEKSSGREEVVDRIKSLLSALLPFFKNTSGQSAFAVNQCPDRTAEWIQIFVFKQPRKIKYQWSKGCDIAGSVEHVGNGLVQFNLQLRNLQPFVKVSMLVNFKTTPQEALIRVDCQTKEAKLYDDKNLETLFDADYSALINPLSQNFLVDNIGGKIKFMKIMGKEEFYETSIKIEENIFKK
jgi:hypothetical protein